MKYLLLLLLLLLLLTCSGCGALQSQQGQQVEVIYHEGGCLMIVDGLSIEQMDEKEKLWLFDEGCKISVKTVVE